MYDFNRLLDWKLLRGSHQFPGPDGGTCLVEAAIVAAGYPYRSVGMADGRAGDLPVSFSWPLVSYAVCLNDAISDDALRQELLLPFVTRFAGSADTPQVEAKRVRLMRWRTISGPLALALAELGFGVWAKAFRRAGDDTARFSEWLVARRRSGRPLPPPAIDSACSYVMERDDDSGTAAWSAARAGTIAADLVGQAARITIHRAMAAILHDAFAIGNQASVVAPEVTAARMEAAKRDAAERERGLVRLPQAAS